jgi:outer membrane biosynthesis protein TonB
VVGSLPEPVTAAEPAAEPEPVMAAEAEPIVEPQPEPTVETMPEPEPDQVAASLASVDGPPHLTIRVTSRGMITAEMDGETEHVILDDLEAYGSALAKVGGTAAIVVTTDDSMAGLIARRAQRILDDAGVQVTVG